jgi:hypothetical protein
MTLTSNLEGISPFKSPWQQIQKELDSMFLSVPDEEIFQAGLSNIEYVTQHHEMSHLGKF